MFYNCFIIVLYAFYTLCTHLASPRRWDAKLGLVGASLHSALRLPPHFSAHAWSIQVRHRPKLHKWTRKCCLALRAKLSMTAFILRSITKCTWRKHATGLSLQKPGGSAEHAHRKNAQTQQWARLSSSSSYGAGCAQHVVAPCPPKQPFFVNAYSKTMRAPTKSWVAVMKGIS